MTRDALHKLAREIARDLFTDGDGVRATRLVIEYRGEQVGVAGWSETALADRIAAQLERKAAAEIEEESES